MGTMIRSAADDTHSPIRALHSLSQVQAISILAGLVSLAPAWTVERHESCDGHLSLIISHAANDTTLLVDRDAKGIHVGLMISDVLHANKHRYPTIETALDAIKAVAGSNTTAAQRYTA